MKKKIITIVLFLVGLGTIFVSVLVYIGFFNSKGSGLLIDTEPASSVYINGKLEGKTPFEQDMEAEELMLRLVPEGNLPSYETKVRLEPGVKTVVKRSFNQDEELTSGATVSFEKTEDGQSLVTIVSIPDNTQVFLDGKAQGFTPLRTKTTEGEHQLQVSSVGYLDKQLPIKAYNGYKLTAVVKLSKDNSPPPTPEAVLSEQTQNLEQVEIKDTGTGFLRVRKEPNSNSEVLGQVTPGQRYDVLEENSSWYKIEVELLVYGDNGGIPTKIQGWVSGEYAEKVAN